MYSFSGGADGGHPFGHLLSIGGTLYGTTVSGGAHNQGTVFAFAP